MSSAEAIQSYLQLIEQLDVEIARLSRLHGSLLNCRPGCSNCCEHFSLLPLEAAVIRQTCSELEEAELDYLHRQAGTNEGCPFLRLQHCLVYPARPIICRTQGLPVAYVDPDLEVVEISACQLNFPTHHEFSSEGLLFLDSYNEQMLLLNQLFISGAPPSPSGRVQMRDLVASLSCRWRAEDR
jgi:uncharacterized protein